MTDTASRIVRLLACLPALMVCLLPIAVHGQTITKCQDEEGNWHYGDFASEACAKSSKVTEIDERGVKVRETDAPPTAEELEARETEKREQQREAEQRARQREEDRRLLRTYDSAQAIVEARDERTAALDRDLESYQLFRQDLVNEKDRLQSEGASSERVGKLEQEIRQYDVAIQSVREERRETIAQFKEELDRYRELTGTGGEEQRSEAGE